MAQYTQHNASMECNDRCSMEKSDGKTLAHCKQGEQEQSRQLRTMESKNTMFAYYNTHSHSHMHTHTVEILSGCIKKNSIILHANSFTQVHKQRQSKIETES